RTASTPPSVKRWYALDTVAGLTWSSRASSRTEGTAAAAGSTPLATRFRTPSSICRQIGRGSEGSMRKGCMTASVYYISDTASTAVVQGERVRRGKRGLGVGAGLLRCNGEETALEARVQGDQARHPPPSLFSPCARAPREATPFQEEIHPRP